MWIGLGFFLYGFGCCAFSEVVHTFISYKFLVSHSSWIFGLLISKGVNSLGFFMEFWMGVTFYVTLGSILFSQCLRQFFMRSPPLKKALNGRAHGVAPGEHSQNPPIWECVSGERFHKKDSLPIFSLYFFKSIKKI